MPRFSVERSLAVNRPELISEWHPTKNGKCTPYNVTAMADKKIWWVGECGHEFESRICHRSRGSGCPFCAGKRVLAGFNDLATLAPELAAQWHSTKNEDKVPSQFTAFTKEPVWWLGVCDHEWPAPIRNRSSGAGCPVCSGRTVLFGFNDFETLKPQLASQWHPTKNGDKRPRDFTVGSGYRAKWLGECSHEWEAQINDRTFYNTQCPHCSTNVSKAEREIGLFVESLGIKIARNKRSIIDGKELDIFIPSEKTAIEYNGVYWHSEKWGKGGKYHLNKWQECKDQGIQLIYIWEDDWEEDKNAIMTKLEGLLVGSLESLLDKASQTVKNGSIEEAAYRKAGFSSGKISDPDFTYVFKHKRRSKDIVSDLSLPKIWDAGTSSFDLSDVPIL